MIPVAKLFNGAGGLLRVATFQEDGGGVKNPSH
jgi:hypothetical protein